MNTIAPSVFERSIDRTVIDQLETLCATSFLNISEFLALDEQERHFDGLVLASSNIHVSLNWKWTLQDTLAGITQVASLDVQLVRSDVAPDELIIDRTFRLTLRIDGTPYDVQIDQGNPSPLLDAANTALSDKQFVELALGDDSYNWVLLPKALDLLELCQLVGYTESGRQPQPAPQFAHYVDPDTPLETKLFFNLHLYTKRDNDPQGETLYLAFYAGDRRSYYASRVMPGQSLAESVSEELKDNFGTYDGEWVFMRGNTYADTTTDKSGQMVERVDVSVVIPYFDPGQYVLAGMHMGWVLAED